MTTQKIKALKIALAAAEQAKAQRQARQQFRCSCGKMHAIQKCSVIQTHWYTPPRGCTDGDYWNQGELQIICPLTNTRNRIMFELRTEVEWDKRGETRFNPERQFSNQYKQLFKEIIDDYEEDPRPIVNNFYFDKNHKKFSIQVAKS